MAEISRPRTIRVGSKPTFLQTHLVTSSLSPVRTLTVTPASLSAVMALAEDSFGRIEKRQIAEENEV